MKAIECYESQVRTYSRSFPAVFTKSAGSTLVDATGKKYLDFFCGAGALNYGHNNPLLKKRLIEYVLGDGITHSLDMATEAKCRFLEKFQSAILQPRSLDYRVQFTGPTGADSVEAALKLARKVTGRHTVLHFVNSYHGVTLGALSVTGSSSRRKSAGLPLPCTVPLLFDGDLGPYVDTLDYFEALIQNSENGIGLPAAVIVESVQAEGGVKVAGFEWLRRLDRIAQDNGIVLILDDIQAGCGRTGDFFSFEAAGIYPGLVCLSKSIGGYGLPMSLVLIRPELDLWSAGEHTGTFRGNNLAFVTATEALSYWEDPSFYASLRSKSRQIASKLESIARSFPEAVTAVRGRGLMYGLVLASEDLAARTAAAAFQRGLVIERCGPKHDVMKVLPPLTISETELQMGLDILEEALISEAAPLRHASAALAG